MRLIEQVAYLYTKVRSEFGKHCSFKDVPAFLLETVPCSTEYDANYVTRNPGITELDTSPHMSGKEYRCMGRSGSRYVAALALVRRVLVRQTSPSQGSYWKVDFPGRRSWVLEAPAD